MKDEKNTPLLSAFDDGERDIAALATKFNCTPAWVRITLGEKRSIKAWERVPLTSIVKSVLADNIVDLLGPMEPSADYYVGISDALKKVVAFLNEVRARSQKFDPEVVTGLAFLSDTLADVAEKALETAEKANEPVKS